MNKETIGVAIVGIGNWVKGIARAIQESEKVKIVTCYTRTKAKRDEFSAEFQCEQESSFEAILKREDVSGIVLTTPNNTHATLTVKAAEHGKHVFVEKPIANTIADAKRMIEACQKNGVVLAVAHNQRRLNGYRKIKGMLQERRLGEVVMVETNFSHNSGLKLTPDAWRWYEDECPGGPIMSLGVHAADTLQYLLGPIKSVSAFLRRLCITAEVIDVGAAILEFDSGTLGYLASNFVTPWIYYCNLYGTEGNVYFTVDLTAPANSRNSRQEYGSNWNNADRYSELYFKHKGENRKIKIDLEYGEVLVEELEEFAGCMQAGRTPEVGGQEGMRSLAVILAAIRSSSSEAAVRVSDILSE